MILYVIDQLVNLVAAKTSEKTETLVNKNITDLFHKQSDKLIKRAEWRKEKTDLETRVQDLELQIETNNALVDLI